MNPVCQPDECHLYLILGQVRRGAFLLVFELGVVLPDHPAVLVDAVPDLRAVPAAAFSTANFAGEGMLYLLIIIRLLQIRNQRTENDPCVILDRSDRFNLLVHTKQLVYCHTRCPD